MANEKLADEWFWLSLREPGCVPERKGPWPKSQTVKVLREFIEARPTAYIDYITVDYQGHPEIEHGPEVLQIADGRSMATGREHNRRVREAEAILREQGEGAEREALVEQIAQFVADWNGATHDGDTFLIADEIREQFGNTENPAPTEAAAPAGVVEAYRQGWLDCAEDVLTATHKDAMNEGAQNYLARIDKGRE